MNATANREQFVLRLKDFCPGEYVVERTLAMYSAAVALADEDAMSRVIRMGRDFGLVSELFYEIVLQSYLFLGFPRMLTAAETLHDVYPARRDGFKLEAVSLEESRHWFDDGVKLCQKVYGEKYDSLADRVAGMAPEVFRWMIIEGYGKVLSRPAVDIVSRELSIIAFLMMEDRGKQLRSHIKGALNVGASLSLVRTVVEDIGRASGQGYMTSLEILSKLG